LDFFLVLLIPLIHGCRCRNTDHVDDIHWWSPSGLAKDLGGRFGVELTVVGGDELIGPVVWLSARNVFPLVKGALGKLIWPVHPIDPGVNMMFVLGSNFEDAGNPVFLGLFPRLHGFSSASGPVNRRAVRDEHEAFADVLDSVD
jgi:hypothetical protein